jgi:hypothetical protein
MLTNVILYAGLLPLVVSASFAFVMRWYRLPPDITGPVATAVGFLIAQFALRGQSGFAESLHTFLEPHEAVDWLPHIVLLTLGVSIVICLAPAHRRWWIALTAALCLAAPVRLLSGNVAQHWSILEKIAVLVSLPAVLGVAWFLLASLDDERPTILSASLQILVAVGTAIVLTQSGVLVYGLSSAALGAAIAGTALASLGAIGSAINGAPGIITFTLGSLIILGHFYAELSTTNAALLFLSLAATAAPLPPLLRSGPPWQRAMARIAFCVLPLAIAVRSAVT